ncbi:MAG TPA: nitroreductase family protein [Candidatus Intestinimonas pullistercoris]|uniref:Nitroreductase family protein n=1 Tax=Candidatus Intestinimonas pullistercoris TaxID=2838623 RepID=A0A9D2P1G1_9FIRM|nr:nitroreductase family protein [Candidatus Intestinimonas pullistercoris]
MNAIFTRRSIRKFTDEPVTDQELEQLLRAGMAAACAKNSQNRLFFVERGTGSLPGLIQVHPNAFALKTAQAAIVVAADRKKGAALDPLNDWWVQDCSAAIQNILVEAADLGLGTLWVGVWPDPKRVLAVQRDLELPEHIAPLGAVAIGRPDKVKEPNDRYEAEKVFFGKYEERS